jgi:hypothetical protein
MVVVDNARRMIGKTIATQVTSVLQTTAGKMIFGRFPEETDAAAPRPERRSFEKSGSSSGGVLDEDRERVKNR